MLSAGDETDLIRVPGEGPRGEGGGGAPHGGQGGELLAETLTFDVGLLPGGRAMSNARRIGVGGLLWMGFFLLSAHGPVGLEPESEDLADLKQDLRDRWPDKRQRAVRKLARLGSPRAWGYVIEALRDPDGRVADQAELALAGLDDPKLLKCLLGRDGLASRDDWVRIRVAEAWGRIEASFDGLRLAKALKPKDEESAVMLLWSLERRALAGRLGAEPNRVLRALRPALRRSAPARVRAAALATATALAAISGESADDVLQQARFDEDAGVRCVALALQIEVGGEGLSAALSAAAGDPALCVRSLALDGLEDRADREALRLLAQRLSVEPRSALRWRSVGCLQRLTGFRHRLDPRPWQRLIDGLPPDWRPEPGKEAAPAGNRTVAFAGLPLLSDRLVFLVDFSGSLWRELEDGRSRKQVVDAALRQTLEALPEGTRFNVIPYTREPHPWREQLVDATRVNVKRAVRDFVDCRERGTGNFYDAALLALSDPEVDTIVTLTDGVPTGGRRYDLDLMVALLLRENRARQVAFDSILVDAPTGVAQRWETLARESGGRSIRLDLE